MLEKLSSLLDKRHGANGRKIAKNGEAERNKIDTKKNHYNELDNRQTFTAYTVHEPWDNQRAGSILWMIKFFFSP